MALNAGVHLGEIFASKLIKPLHVSTRSIKKGFAYTLIQLQGRKKRFEEQTDEAKLLELKRRSRFFEWNHGAEIYAFGKRLQEDFRLDLLSQAFVHRSYIEFGTKTMKELKVEAAAVDIKTNDYLIEIGNQVISKYVKNYISHFLPRFPLEGIEGIHNFLVSEEKLAHVSKNLGTTHIILSADYPVEVSTYSNTLKAIVGALSESQGIERANLLVRDLIVTQISGEDVNDFLPIDDYLKTLTDILARDGCEAPEPRLICQSAKNTVLANYHVGLYCSKEFIGHCSGESIDVAIQMAALDALKRLFHTTDSSTPIRFDVDLSSSKTINSNLSLSEWSCSKIDAIA